MIFNKIFMFETQNCWTVQKIMFNHRKQFDMIVTLFYTLFSLTKATDPPSTFVDVRRFDPVAGENASTFYDEVSDSAV